MGVGDHDFLRHPSFVSYHQMRIFSEKLIVERICEGVFLDKGKISERIFALICLGVETSRLSAPKYKAYFCKAVVSGMGSRGISGAEAKSNR